jgi:hypothetical protein
MSSLFKTQFVGMGETACHSDGRTRVEWHFVTVAD